MPGRVDRGEKDRGWEGVDYGGISENADMRGPLTGGGDPSRATPCITSSSAATTRLDRTRLDSDSIGLPT